jgi:hypothetical protein
MVVIQTMLQTINSLFNLLNTPEDSKELRDNLKIERDQCLEMIKTTSALLQKPVLYEEQRANHAKTMSEFAKLVAQCKSLTQASIQKERSFPLGSIDANKKSCESTNYHHTHKILQTAFTNHCN